jgi:hypothetical protein
MALGWLGIQQRTDSSKESLKYPWLFQCPEPNCFWAVAADSKEQAESIRITHPCPFWGGPTRISGEITMTLVQQMWDRADFVMDELTANMALQESEPNDERAAEILKQQGRLRGFAEFLAIFMQPHFSTEEECAQEIRRRWRARQNGDTDYVTKGLAARRYELPRTEDKPPIGSPGRPRLPQPTTAQHSLSEQEVKAIKFAAQSSMFTQAELAKTYKVPESVIVQLISS